MVYTQNVGSSILSAPKRPLVYQVVFFYTKPSLSFPRLVLSIYPQYKNEIIVEPSLSQNKKSHLDDISRNLQMECQLGVKKQPPTQCIGGSSITDLSPH